MWRCLAVSELTSRLSDSESLSELAQKTLENTDFSNSSDVYTLYCLFYSLQSEEIVGNLLEVVCSLLVSLDTSKFICIMQRCIARPTFAKLENILGSFGHVEKIQFLIILSKF